MSRVANSPVAGPKGVEINMDGANLSVKGGKGSLDLMLTSGIGVVIPRSLVRLLKRSWACQSPLSKDSMASVIS